jgi:hypothetical protein
MDRIGPCLALGYCRLPTQPCACFVKLKESFIVKNQLSCNRQQRSSSQFRNFWASCRSETRSIFDFGKGRRLLARVQVETPEAKIVGSTCASQLNADRDVEDQRQDWLGSKKPHG